MMNETSTEDQISNGRRFLHYTLKITDRLASIDFFCSILGMKILRHEEMESGCVAKCNGDFDSPWSKTMVGYGDEHSFFAFELNYNYFVKTYEYGNDFSSVTIRNRQAVANARDKMDKKNIEATNADSIVVRSPDGHRFILLDDDVLPCDDPVQCLSLHVSDLEKSIYYYSNLLRMKTDGKKPVGGGVKLYYGLKTSDQSSKKRTNSDFLIDNQCELELIELSIPIQRGNGYGRIAFSCATADVRLIEDAVQSEDYAIAVSSMELGDPSQNNQVTVVVLSDPDGHEICFVGDDNYSKLCQTNSNAETAFLTGLKTTYDEPYQDESTNNNNMIHS